MRYFSFRRVSTCAITREMLEAIKSHDKEWGGSLVTKHMGRYDVDEKLIREQYPEYFK